MCQEVNTDPLAGGRKVTAADLVEDVSALLTHARFYGAGHRVVADAIESTLRIYAELESTRDHRPVEIGCADGWLFADARPLLRADRAALRLRPLLEAMGAGGIVFRPGLGAQDLRALVALAARRDLASLDVAAANRVLASDGAVAIGLLDAYSQAPAPGADDPVVGRGRGGVRVSGEMYEVLFDHLTKVMLQYVRGDLPFLEETKSQVESFLSRLSEDAASVFDTTHRETSRSDLFQFRHSIRVGCLALEFARALTTDSDLLLRIGTAALLHDVGKRDVPPEVLRHPGLLEGEMLAAMRRHPVHGARLLLRMPDSDPLAVAIAFCHHHRPDGHGYPETAHRADLSLSTRIVKICDVYEALTADRPYKPRMTPRRAYRVMMAMGEQFDRPLLRRFIEVVGVFPAGTRVRLASGAVARVVAQTDDLDRPVVVPEGESESVDLRGPGGGAHGEIVDYADDDRETAGAPVGATGRSA